MNRDEGIELQGCLIKAVRGKIVPARVIGIYKNYKCTSRSSWWYRKWYCVMSYNTMSHDM